MSITDDELDAQRRGAAKNQSLFREVNERIEDLAGSSFTSFVCECLNDRCDERVVLTIEEYERIRAQPAWFFVLAGHEARDVEDVVDRNDRYLIVRKLGVGQRVAEKLNPRNRR